MALSANPAKSMIGIAGFFILALVGYDLVRAYSLPIELNNAMGGHYLFFVIPSVSSSHAMRKGLHTKKRDWRKSDIEFTYYLRRGGRGTHIFGKAIVETRFLKYAGLETIEVSMDRDVFVTQTAEIQESITDVMDTLNRSMKRAR